MTTPGDGPVVEPTTAVGGGEQPSPTAGPSLRSERPDLAVRMSRSRGQEVPISRGGCGRGPRTGWGERAGWTLAVAVPLVFLGLLFAWPVLTLVGRGLAPDGALDLTGFGEVLTRARTWRIIRQTLLQATLGTLFCVLLGVPGALVLYRRRFPGRDLLRGLVIVPFVLPSVVVGVAFHALVTTGGPVGSLHLDGTTTTVVAALVFFNYGLVVRTVGTMWSRLDPRAVEAARALGASPWRAFRTVTLPSLMPAIASAASLTFLFCATAYGVLLVLGGTGIGRTAHGENAPGPQGPRAMAQLPRARGPGGGPRDRFSPSASPEDPEAQGLRGLRARGSGRPPRSPGRRAARPSGRWPGAGRRCVPLP